MPQTARPRREPLELDHGVIRAEDSPRIPLLTHILTIIDSNDRRYDQRHLALVEAMRTDQATQKMAVEQAVGSVDRAVIKADAANEKRFESVNEFRSALADQQRLLIPRSEFDAVVHALTEKIDVLTAQLVTLNAERVGIKGGWGYAVGVVGFIAVVASLVWQMKP